MSAPEDDPRASIAGLSEAGARAPAHDGGFELPAPRDRYRELEVVGTGGLGTVLLARDELLAREVALKRIGPRAEDSTAGAQFLREARITARLDHPGIVPIHDAGITEDGRLFYTMRLIRGRTLGELLAEAPDPEARLAVIPSVIAACHAVGYAHRKQIIHRDLKPANIMVGELGETQVVDWGLAEDLGEGATLAGLTGTAVYTSPEVARGESPSIASDVWALGVVLHEVVAGAARFSGTRDEVLAALRRTLAPARWPEGCPPELAAIGDRAMAVDPGARYADAHALALDLEAYRDGRRVRAHSYSPLELARRAVIALRWPLAIAATAVIVTIVALALTAHRTEQQRVRAEAAEHRAREELARSEAALATELATSSSVALADRSFARAEQTATAALAHGERAEARGVLSAIRPWSRLALVDEVVLPGCPRAVPARGFALCVGGGRVARWSLSPVAEQWRAPLALDGALPVGAGFVAGWTRAGEVVVLDATSGAVVRRDRPLAAVVAAAGAPSGDRVVLHDGHDVVAVIGDGTIDANAQICGTREIAVAASSATTTWLVCAGGALGRVGGRGFERVEDTQFGSEVPPATALAAADDDSVLVLGGAGGDVYRFACTGAACRSQRFTLEAGTAVRELASVGADVLVRHDRGDATLLRSGIAGEVAYAPIADGPWLVDASAITTGGTAIRRWRAATDATPARLVHFTGLATVALGKGGALAAARTAEGEIVVWDTTRGALLHAFGVGELGRVDALAFDATGASLWIATSDRGDRTFELASARWREGAARPPAPVPACSAELSTGIAVTCGARTWTLDTASLAITSIAVSADGRRVVAGTASGEIVVWDVATKNVIARAIGHRQRVSWLEITGNVLWSAGWDGVLRRWDAKAWDTHSPAP